jgi:hypothetical protein
MQEFESKGLKFAGGYKPTKFKFFENHKDYYKFVEFSIEDNKIYFKCFNNKK